jgi:SAM-dependent methyltransferase
LAFSLAPTPPANAFVPADALDREQERFPLDVFFCEDCFHLQLLDVVDPALLFENYVYVSGTSPVFVRHFEMYAQDVMTRFGVKGPALVVDIGSNDGTLLRFFQRAGCRVQGIDPARRIAEAATASGIPTAAAFFTPALADALRRDLGPAAVITANNVFAHIDDLDDVVEGVKRLLAPDGVYVFEVSYLVDVLQKTLFDTIYHEHLDYHAVRPLIPFFEKHGMQLIEALRVPSHGGSLRGVAQRIGGPYSVGASVGAAVVEEEALSLHRLETYRAFARNIDALKEQLGHLLRELKAQGKRIAAFGAPAKATTLMFHFGIGPDLIEFIVDDSPLKQGLFSPGYHIPVVPAATLYERRPDYTVVLAWNFAEPIMRAHRRYTDEGGHFIVPLPALQVY